MIKIAPSILAANPMRMGEEVKRMVAAGCDVLHVDIMDGHFVPNLSYGPSMVSALKREVAVPLDVHLMVSDPESFIGPFAKAGADTLTVHEETGQPLPALLSAIRSLGVLAGVSIKPKTPVQTLEPYFSLIDLILVMTVEPGFGGQAFMPEMVEKIKMLRKMGYQGDIEVDGGVGPQNAKLLMDSGATVLVMGTALFTSPDPAGVMSGIRALNQPHGA